MNFGTKSPEFYPKYTHYGSDGQGRDSYILKHNGGLWKEPTRPFFETTHYVREKPSVMGPAPLKDATSFKYISDGSGRDFYITYNSGGLEAPYIPGATRSDNNFITSLRSGTKLMGNKRLSTPAEKQRMKKSNSAQRLLVRRLTATSKEWRKIAKENKRQSISREKELRSPTAAQYNRLFEMQATRNELINRPMLMYNHIKDQVSPTSSVQGNNGYPSYSRSTKNLVISSFLFFNIAFSRW